LTAGSSVRKSVHSSTVNLNHDRTEAVSAVAATLAKTGILQRDFMARRVQPLNLVNQPFNVGGSLSYHLG
jgi:hypothetical protein